MCLRIRISLVLSLFCAVTAQAEGTTLVGGKMSLSSSAFLPGQDIPEQYSCRGADVNPPFDIKNVPPKTKALAMTVHSPDSPEGIWVHWVVYNIPSSRTAIAEGSIPGWQALNDFGRFNYNGPCPSDDRPHTYIFRAYALDSALSENEGMVMKDLEKEMKGHVLSQADLTGTYRKPMW